MKDGEDMAASRAPSDVSGIRISDVVDRGEVVNARATDSYYANRAQTIADGADFHLFFCGSGKPYVHGEGPEWWTNDYRQQQYARDKLFYKQLRGLDGPVQKENARNIIFASMETGSANGSPFFGPDQWKENFKHGACVSSTVFYHGNYYTFFEKQHYVEHSPTTDKELHGIGVARTVGGAKPGDGVEWEILNDDGIWRVPSHEQNDPRKSVIMPAIMRAKFGAKKSEDHVLNNDYAEYNGAMAPCAIVVNDVLYVYYTDDTHHLALLWEWREVFDWKPLDDGTGPPGDIDYVEEDEWPDEPRNYAKYRVAFPMVDGEVDFSANSEEIDLDADPLGVEHAAEMVISPGYNGGFAPHQKIKYSEDLSGGSFLVFVLEPDAEANVVRIRYLASADGLTWAGPIDCGFLDYYDPRYVDGTLDVSSDWEGHLNLGEHLLFTYPRYWEYQMEVPVSDRYTHLYTGPLYAGGWNLYAFSGKLTLGPPHPALSIPAVRSDDRFPDPRLRIDGVRRRENWLFLHADGNQLSTTEPAECFLFFEDASGIVSLISQTTLPSIWGPGALGWFSYSLHAANLASLLSQPGYFATLRVAHRTARNAGAMVAVPLAVDEELEGGWGHNYRPVSVHTIIPWVVPGDPEARGTGVYFAGMLNPKAFDGKRTRIRLHWRLPIGLSYAPVDYEVIDIESTPSNYWAEPFLHAYVDKHTRVYYINLPQTAGATSGPFGGDQDRFVSEGWSCVAEILDGDNGTKDRLFVPLTAAGL